MVIFGALVLHIWKKENWKGKCEYSHIQKIFLALEIISLLSFHLDCLLPKHPGGHNDGDNSETTRAHNANKSGKAKEEDVRKGSLHRVNFLSQPKLENKVPKVRIVNFKVGKYFSPQNQE